MNCQYCGHLPKLVTGAVIYPHREDLAHKQIWLCAPCGAYVGCHPGTTTPLGQLADAELRRARLDAHTAFDKIWRSKKMTRSQAYGWLAQQLGITKPECHMGSFTVELCRKVMEVCR